MQEQEKKQPIRLAGFSFDPLTEKLRISLKIYVSGSQRRAPPITLCSSRSR